LFDVARTAPLDDASVGLCRAVAQVKSPTGSRPGHDAGKRLAINPPILAFALLARANYGSARSMEAPNTRSDQPTRRDRAALLGLALGVGGVLAYFLVVFRFAAWMPEVRNRAVPNWILVACGLALSALGVLRARARPARDRGRILAPVLAATNVAVAAAFAWILYGLPALPPVPGPPLGAPAPDFTLTDQSGHNVRLADFHGAPLLLVFYRGHW